MRSLWRVSLFYLLLLEMLCAAEMVQSELQRSSRSAVTSNSEKQQPLIMTAQSRVVKTASRPTNPVAIIHASNGFEQDLLNGWKPASAPASGLEIKAAGKAEPDSRQQNYEHSPFREDVNLISNEILANAEQQQPIYDSSSAPLRNYIHRESLTHAELKNPFTYSKDNNYHPSLDKSPYFPYPAQSNLDRFFLYGSPLSSYFKQDGAFFSILIIGSIVLLAFVLVQPYVTYNLNGKRKRSSDVDWESLNILDYISMMEEMWRKFDVKDMACQKRVLCEIHQNESAFGPAASRIVKIFSYMRYLSLMSLPDAVKEMIQDYQEAVDRGGDQDTDCGQVYDSCDFSFKDTFTKYIGPKQNSLK